MGKTNPSLLPLSFVKYVTLDIQIAIRKGLTGHGSNSKMEE